MNLFLILGLALSPQDSARSVLDRARQIRQEFHHRVKSFRLELDSKSILEKSHDVGDPVRGLTLAQTTLYWSADHGKRLVERSRYHIQNLGLLGQYNDRQWSVIEDVGADFTVGHTTVRGPLSGDAGEYYAFRLEGSSDGITRLIAEPLDPHQPLGYTIMRIDDATGEVLEIEMKFNQAVKLLPEPGHLSVRQTFQRIDGVLLPHETYWDYEAEIPFAGTYRLMTHVRVVSALINPVIGRGVFFRPLWSREGGFDEGASLWNIPLTEGQRQSLQRLGNANRTDTSDFRKNKERKNWRWKPLPDARFNRVEGLFAGGELRLSGVRIEPFFPNLYAQAKAGYGFADKRWKYQFEISRGLFGYHLRVGGRYYNDIHHQEVESLVGTTFNNTLTSLGYRYDRFNYFYVKGYDLYTELKPYHHITLSVTYTDRLDDSTRQNTNYGLIRSYEKYAPVVGINEGRLRRVSVEGNWKIGDGKGIRARQPYQILTVGIEHTNPNWLKSDFHFTKFYSTVRFHWPTTARGSLDGKFYSGYAKDALPQQYLFILYGGGTPYVMKTVDVGEFQGNYTVACAIEYNSGGEWLERTGLPGLRRGNIDFIPVLRMGYIRASKQTQGDLVNPVLFFKRPLYEAGFAIGDIYRIVRVDVSWRLNQRHIGSRNFGISATAFLFDL